MGADPVTYKWRNAVARIDVGGKDYGDDDETKESILALANVRVATGTTKRQQRATLMRAFNTPFFPDIFVCSQVMGEGVDLQRYCRHVIHLTALLLTHVCQGSSFKTSISIFLYVRIGFTLF